MSAFTIDSTALAIIHLAVSPMPMGRTLGFLFRARRRQVSRGEMDFGSKKEVQILLAVEASLLHRSREAPLNEVHILLQPCASMHMAVHLCISTAHFSTLARVDPLPL